MCGILISNYPDIKDFNLHLNTISHRGPDYQNFLKFDHIHFGHCRLKIIDLNDRSNQPFSNDKSILCFNGEIYNYKQLKLKYLKSEKFKTNSDTEVLFKLLEKYGIQIVSELDGIFAFSFYEKENKKLHLVRDFLGVKPLYYKLDEDFKVSVCSEIRGIRSIDPSISIDSNSVYEFLLNGFVYEPDTGITEIKKIPLGKILTIDFKRTTKYYTEYHPRTKITSFEKDLRSSINEQMVSDVPVGLFYSGGVDSSIILSESDRTIKPFILGSNKSQERNEGVSSDLKYGKLIAEKIGSDLNILESDIKESSFLQEIHQCVVGNEELIADHTFISSKELSREFRKTGHIVALSGMGADELFGGYNRYLAIKYYFLLELIKPFLGLMKKLKYLKKKVSRINSSLNEKNFLFTYSALIGPFAANEIDKYSDFSKEKSNYLDKLEKMIKGVNGSKFKKAMILDRYGFLSHNFIVADKSSMSESIEMRVPLVSNKLLKHSEKFTEQELIRGVKLKNPLKILLEKKIPKRFVNRRKRGFNPLLTNQINELFKDGSIFKELNEDSRVCQYLNYQFILSILQNHSNSYEDNTYKIYNLLTLEYWLKENINR